MTSTAERQYILPPEDINANLDIDASYTGAGSLSCPWRIQAPSGQTVNLGVVVFQRNVSLSLLIDDGDEVMHVVQLGDDEPCRERHLYSSQYSQISVYVSDVTAPRWSLDGDDGVAFMLHYSCRLPYILLDKNQWFERSELC